WVFPGNMTESRIYKRTHAIGPDRPMPPNAAELLQTSADHRKVVGELATLIQTMVPGDSYVVTTTGALLKIRNENKTICGSVPDGGSVLVLDRSPREMPGFVRVYQPPKKYFNGNCPLTSKY